jgi:glycosyltransferase involved in cell wall biosynthesis
MKAETETLVILSPGFPADESDSTCLPAQQALVRCLHSLRPGLHITVIAFHYPDTRVQYKWGRTSVIPLGGGNRPRFFRLLTWYRAWNLLRKICKHQKPSGILSFWHTEAALVATWYCRWKGLRHLSWILGQDAGKENKYVRWTRPASGDLVAMSDFLAAEFFRCHRRRPAHVIPNGVDPDQFGPPAPVRDIDLLGVGSLIPLKQYEVFLRMAARLKIDFPSLRCRIAGQGPEAARLKSLAAEMQLEDTVIFEGELSHARVLGLMQRSRVLLHPSRYEGFSTACLEALYAGACVVSFTRPMEQWIRNWYYMNDEEEMYLTLKQLLGAGDAGGGPVLPYSMKESAAAFLELFGL